MKRIAILLLGILLFCACCTEEQPQTPTPIQTSPVPTEQNATPATPVQPTPTLEEVPWTADGIIRIGEYQNQLEFAGGQFTVFWKNDNLKLYMALRGEAAGWVSIGFEPTSSMKDADMLFGWVDAGETFIEDMYSTGTFGPHPPDIDLGGTYDIQSAAGTEMNGVTIIEFSRSLDTKDPYDKAFTPGQTVSFIWAIANSDIPTFKHNVAKGSGQLALD